MQLAKACYERKISLAFDTSACTFNKNNLLFFKQIIKFKPLFIVDIKALTASKHKKITGVNGLQEIELIKFLENNKLDYWVRYVLLEKYTDSSNDIKTLKSFCKKLKYMKNFAFLPFHNMANNKYKNLGLKYTLETKKSYDIKKLNILKAFFKSA
jgi:pyruvate formate lyase activating enzyme